VDLDFVYLLPETAFQFAHEAARREGGVFSIEPRTLLRLLDEEGLIEVEHEAGQVRRTVRVRFGSSRSRVIKFRRAFLNPLLEAAPESILEGSDGAGTGGSAKDTDTPRFF
jgi:hypothetical protein